MAKQAEQLKGRGITKRTQQLLAAMALKMRLLEARKKEKTMFKWLVKTVLHILVKIALYIHRR